MLPERLRRFLTNEATQPCCVASPRRSLAWPLSLLRAAAAMGPGSTRFLELAGVAVWERERPRRQDRRRGKTDLIDAALAGRRLLACEGLRVPSAQSRGAVSTTFP
jgi:hypothetical protein